MSASLNTTLGAVEIGVLFSCILYGITTVQVYIYSENFKKDKWYLKLLVAWIWISETAHEALLCIYVYDLSVTHFGDSDHINSIPIELSLSVTVTAFVGTAVQAFFAWRVWVMSRNLIIPIIAWSGAILGFAMSVAITVFMAESGTLPEFDARFGWSATFTPAVHSVVDLLNTGALLATLASRKSQFTGTSRVIEKLMIYTVETGLVTSVFAVAMLITRVALSSELTWVGFLMVYAKLYSNSLMASLNARVKLQDMENVHTSEGLGRVSAGSPPERRSTSVIRMFHVGVDSGLSTTRTTANSLHSSTMDSPMFKLGELQLGDNDDRC